MRVRVDARLQSRYVEYSGHKRVYVSVWRDYLSTTGNKCPEGCLMVGWFTRKKAFETKKEFDLIEARGGCNNFEYRVI